MRRARNAGKGGYVKEFNFNSEVNRLVKSLEALDKLPAIVFCMSRKACVNAALTVHGNPLLGTGPKKKPPKEDLEVCGEMASRGSRSSNMARWQVGSRSRYMVRWRVGSRENKVRR